MSLGAAAAGLRLPSGVEAASANDRRAAVRIALAVLDASGAVVAHSDTVRHLRLPSGLPERAVLPFHLTTRLAPGSYTYALRVEGGEAATATPHMGTDDATSHPGKPGTGAVWRGRLSVPELSGASGGVRLSSIALGRAGTVDAWRRGAVALGLLPTHVVQQDRRVTLYYEVYGLAAGDRPETEITIEKTGRKLFGKRDRLVLRFREDAAPDAGGWVRTTRQLDLSRLERGEYRLQVRILRSGDGARAEQETGLTIR